MSVVEGEVVNARGQKLYTIQYRASEPIGALLLWHHGYGEHTGRYKPFFTKLAESGIHVFAFDAHSFGRSEGERGLILKFQHLVDDVSLMRDAALEQFPSVNVFMGGQSMGGIVACHVVASQPALFAGLVLQSAAINIVWTPVIRVQAAMGSILQAIIPKQRIVPAVRPADMSRDPQVVKDYVEDPLNYPGNLRVKTAYELQQGMLSLEKLYAKITLPVLANHGTHDLTTSLDSLKHMLKEAASQDVTLNEIEGGYHELLMGPEKEGVFDTVATWITRKTQASEPEAGTA